MGLKTVARVSNSLRMQKETIILKMKKKQLTRKNAENDSFCLKPQQLHTTINSITVA